MDTTIQLGVIIIGALGLSIPFGLYIARMISFEMRPLVRPESTYWDEIQD